MDESEKHQPQSGTASSGSSGWSVPETGDIPDDASTNLRGKTRSHQSGAKTSGSPIPARVGKSNELADTPYAIRGTLSPAPRKPEQMSQKAVVGVIAVAVVLSFAVVVALYLMTQGSNELPPAAEDRTIQPPPAPGSAGTASQPKQIRLEGLSFLLPAGWNYEKVEEGYNLGPTSNPSQVKMYLNYKGNSLQKLRPMCGSAAETEEAPEPIPNQDLEDTQSPDQKSPSPSPSPSATANIFGIVRDTFTLIGGEQAISESGNFECDSQETRSFTSIIVTSKGFAMTFSDLTPEVDSLISSIVFE